METKYLKETLFELFDKYTEYEDIISALRSLNSLNEISDEEYDIIFISYDKWLKEYENDLEIKKEYNIEELKHIKWECE